jgi:hypothetical protein
MAAPDFFRNFVERSVLINLAAIYIPGAGTLISTLPKTCPAESGNQEITATFTGKIVFAT